MLGASQNIHPGALPLFRDKRVRLLPHDDAAGKQAVTRWSGQLRGVAAEVDVFNFGGLVQINGRPVKDVNDFMCVNEEGLKEVGKVLP